jgi:competence protein ComEC
LLLWLGRFRLWGLAPLSIGVIAALAAPTPAILVTGDGRHVAVVRDDGTPVLLRERSGDFVRDLMSEVAAFDGMPISMDEQKGARCSRDACLTDMVRDGRAWRLLAIRSPDRIAWAELTRTCADADLVVADRRLPRGCRPRWLKLDRETLAVTGGVAIFLDSHPRIVTVVDQVGNHPWRAGQ